MSPPSFKFSNLRLAIGGRDFTPATSRISHDLFVDNSGGIEPLQGFVTLPPREKAELALSGRSVLGPYVASGSFTITDEGQKLFKRMAHLGYPEAARAGWHLPYGTGMSQEEMPHSRWPRKNLGGRRVSRRWKKWAKAQDAQLFAEMRSAWKHLHASKDAVLMALICGCRACVQHRRETRRMLKAGRPHVVAEGQWKSSTALEDVTGAQALPSLIAFPGPPAFYRVKSTPLRVDFRLMNDFTLHLPGASR